jgi:hypothetical protein
LPGLKPTEFEELAPQQKEVLLGYVSTRFREYLDGFYKSSNLCVDKYNTFRKVHHRWRYTAIIGTGCLACLNFLAAQQDLVKQWGWVVVPKVAAIAALILAVLANLEAFGNSAERAQGYRESRELFLDAAQEFDRVWTIAVNALGDTPQAYLNAIELYRRIVAADRDLRSTFKELSAK